MRTSDGISKNQYEDLCGKIHLLILDVVNNINNDTELLEFLKINPFPPNGNNLSSDKRIYCLLLNRMKNWVAREQSKKDGGQYWKSKFKKNPIGVCQICNRGFTTNDDIEFHHTLRDGRKPIPLHKECHKIV